MTDVWMISNRQPWPEALLRGLISCKTRSVAVHLPPCGATVYLHASKALWRGWRDLWWVEKHGIDVPNLPRGGIVGVATLSENGLTRSIMQEKDAAYFYCGWNFCGAEQTMYFTDVRRTPFIPCRGAQVPTRKLPAEVEMWHEANAAGSV